MGIRIDINWEFVSPILQTASGILKIVEVNNDLQLRIEPKTLLICKCHINKYSLGFSEIKEGQGVPTKIFKIFEERIKAIIRAYFDGILLEKNLYNWVDRSFKDNKLSEELQQKSNEGAKYETEISETIDSFF